MRNVKKEYNVQTETKVKLKMLGFTAQQQFNIDLYV
jgi:hypothetical protein